MYTETLPKFKEESIEELHWSIALYCVDTWTLRNVKLKVKVKFALEQATKVQMGSRI